MKIRELWRPALVVALGSALTVAGWQMLLREQREGLRASAEAVAAQSRRAIELQLRRQWEAAQELAGFWSRVGRRPLGEWRADANLAIENLPGLAYLAWVGPDGAPTRVATGEGRDAPPPEIDAGEARAHLDAPALVGPDRAADGSALLRMYRPVRAPDGRTLGVLVEGVRVADLLAPVLRGGSPGYAVEVLWGGSPILTWGDPVPDGELAWWVVEGDVPLPEGGTWRVVHRPTQAMVAARLRGLPHVVLAAGLLLSLALGALAHELSQSRRTALLLDAANRELDARYRGVQAEEAELRRLKDQLEALVDERTRELEEAVTDLRAFNASVSHDLRSPIGAILNFAAILEEDHRDALDEQGVRLLRRIRDSASRGSKLLDGLSLLARAGRGEPEREEIDMTALAREAFTEVHAAAGSPEVELLIDDVPPARGDPALVRDVLTNLLGNALKYSRGRDKPHIEFTGHRSDGEVTYCVADRGVGFDMRFAEKLFGVFERLHTSEEFEGTGVGLAVAARIVRRHGGRVWAEGEPGRGARFYFTLPAAGEAT